MIGRILAGVLIAALFAGVAGAAPSDSTKSVPDNPPSTQPETSVGNGVSEPAQTAPKANPKKSKKSKSKGKSMTAAGTMPVKPAIAPAHIEVQHVLIGFSGSVPGKNITRTKEEAMKLAHEILDKARKGANFDSLVAKYTDDSPPGIYKMAAEGVPPQQGEYGRKQMVPAFGNVGFAISPGNIDIAEYDPATSPFGWHIIKRLR
ncbi:MAG TPA: peptidylprolyl isomerase [Candidatus Dormibacteraeota bacterium]|nr:peptidylprolyl isomerase [Candidatus Dormibacteraeota bacterium]